MISLKQIVYQLLNKYNGTLSMKDAKAAGISATTITRMVNNGELEREYPGYFTLPGHFSDELLIAQKQYQRGIISHVSALDLYDLTDNIPKKIDLTVPRGYNVPKDRLANFAIELHFTKSEWYELGKTTYNSRFGNEIVIYDRERTLCDIWNPWTQLDAEVRYKALQRYMVSDERNIRKLNEYRSIFPTLSELRAAVIALN